MHTLLLWDIDGTLIDSGGAGMGALQLALNKAFGISGLLDDIEFSGRTDRWIVRQIFAKFDLAPDEGNFARYFEAYLEILPSSMAQKKGRVLPGVRALLDAAAARGGVSQGLLTGNWRRGAELKLGYHGLWDYFPFGAFADDDERRDALGPHALRRARESAGVEFDPRRTWIVGDTPHDVTCARAIGARVLVVATGLHPANKLAAYRPDAILPDLGDAEAFWRIVSR